jgi:hypothetical protein
MAVEGEVELPVALTHDGESCLRKSPEQGLAERFNRLLLHLASGTTTVNSSTPLTHLGAQPAVVTIFFLSFALSLHCYRSSRALRSLCCLFFTAVASAHVLTITITT